MEFGISSLWQKVKQYNHLIQPWQPYSVRKQINCDWATHTHRDNLGPFSATKKGY